MEYRDLNKEKKKSSLVIVLISLAAVLLLPNQIWKRSQSLHLPTVRDLIKYLAFRDDWI